MKRSRGNFFWFILLTLATHSVQAQVRKRDTREPAETPTGMQDRSYWCNLLYKISYPVIHNLAEGTLRRNMPLEKAPGYYLKAEKVSYLEAVSRTLSGIAPWLTLAEEDSPEGKMRRSLRIEILKGLPKAVDPASADYLDFRSEPQAIVDAAFLAEAFLRAPKVLWEPLDSITKSRFIIEFKSLRNRKPAYNNWLLFSALTEAFLLQIGEQYDPARIDFAIHKMSEWYLGDGWYSDGEHFAMDYYNSFVIHSMMVELVQVLAAHKMAGSRELETALKRMVRYAEFQERIISPEGTFPPIGRSLPYRSAAFQALAHISLLEKLPNQIRPAQVRSALTLVFKNLFEQPGTFDEKGWLQIGFAGHQPSIADPYTSTGSLYLCTTGFLALGLPPNNRFWTDPPARWTSQKAWNGEPVDKDHKSE